MRYALAMAQSPPRSRKRRRILYGIVALLALVALMAPGLLGRVVYSQTSAALAERWPAATVRWQRGWFGSRVEAADGQSHLVLQFRHPALADAALLGAWGRLRLLEPAASIELQARLDWALGLTVEADAPSLRGQGVVNIDAEWLALRMERQRSGATDLRIESAALALTRAPDARLDLRPVALQLAANGADPGQLRLDLQATRAGAAQSEATLTVDGIDGERAAALSSAVQAAVQAPPGSASESLAWIGVASAWEQLTRAGLALRLDPLALDGQTRIVATWVPAEGGIRFQGDGALAAVEDWWAPIMALSYGEPEWRFREQFQASTQALDPASEIASGITIVGDRFELNPGPAPVP